MCVCVGYDCETVRKSNKRYPQQRFDFFAVFVVEGNSFSDRKNCFISLRFVLLNANTARSGVNLCKGNKIIIRSI